MQTVNLPLFTTNDASTITISTPEREAKHTETNHQRLFEPLEKALQETFFQNPEENTVIKVKRILGERAKDMSDEQIQCTVTEFQFLIKTWLDEFEKDIFSGMTLKELLNEK